MATSDLETVLRRVIQILNANPSAFSSNVSGEVGAFPYDEEIVNAILAADEMIAVEGYFNSVNSSLSSPFLVTSQELTNSEALPVMRGRANLRTIEYSMEVRSPDTGDLIETWDSAVEAKHRDDVRAAGILSGYGEQNAFEHLYKFEDGKIYTAARRVRVTYPVYARTAALQTNQNEETLVIATAVRLLVKNASNAPFEYWIKESLRGIQALVTDGAYRQANEVNE